MIETEDQTFVKLAAIGAITVLAAVYFITVKSDGAIFGTVSTVISATLGYELGKRTS